MIRRFLVTTTRSPRCNANFRNASADKNASDDSIPTAIFDVGEITSGREKSAWAEIGNTTNASTSGQRIGPPAENA